MSILTIIVAITIFVFPCVWMEILPPLVWEPQGAQPHSLSISPGKWIFREILRIFSPNLLGEIIISQIFRNFFPQTILAIQNWKCDVLHVWCGILIRVWVNTGSHLQFKFQAKLGVAGSHKHFSCHFIECANVVTHQSILPFPKKRQSKSYLKGITSFKLATTSL